MTRDPDRRLPHGRPSGWHPPPPAPGAGVLPPLDPHGGTRPGEEGTVLDLSTNVVPFPPDEEVVAAVRGAPLERYPDPEARGARQALGAHWGVDPARLLLAPGGSELLHRVALAFLRPGDRVLVLGSTFGEYARAARLRGAEVVHLGRGRDHLPAPAEAEAAVRGGVDRRDAGRVGAGGPPFRLVFLCTPNNPTGDAWSQAEVRGLAEAIPPGALLVLDESYASFPARGLVPPHLPGWGPVLHLRSLTKDLALPGLRIAAAEGDPRVLDTLHAVAPPWPVSTPALAAVEAALRPGPLARLAERLAETARRREALARALEARGWAPRPSCTGFLLLPVPAGTTGAEVARRLEAAGVRVRDATSFGLPGHIRVGVGSAAEHARFLEALDAVGLGAAPAPAPAAGTAPSASPPRTLVLVRHGATALNEARRFQGWSDPSLSPEGRRQVEALAAGWEARFGVLPPVIHGSDLARALETARILAPGAELRPDPRLRELHFGAFEGCTAQEAETRHPEAWARWMKDPDAHPPPGGEALGTFRARVGAWLAELLSLEDDGRTSPLRGRTAPLRGENAPLVVVAHGGTVGEILRRLGREDLPVPRPGEAVEVALPRDRPLAPPRDRGHP